MIDKITKFVIKVCRHFLGIGKDGDSSTTLAITIVIEYFILVCMAILIAFNVQSFLKKLLVTLKNILRDNDIQLSYSTLILYFSFIMGSYYFSVLLQMSMQLPAAKQEPFEYLLINFTPTLVMYTTDCFFVISSLLAGFLIWFNWLVKRVPK